MCRHQTNASFNSPLMRCLLKNFEKKKGDDEINFSPDEIDKIFTSPPTCVGRLSLCAASKRKSFYLRIYHIVFTAMKFPEESNRNAYLVLFEFITTTYPTNVMLLLKTANAFSNTKSG